MTDLAKWDVERRGCLPRALVGLGVTAVMAGLTAGLALGLAVAARAVTR